MQKDSTVITIISIVFIAVLIITVVLSIKYINQSTQEANQANNQEVTAATTPAVQESQNNTMQDLIEIEQTLGNDYIDLYLSNSVNLSALEFEIVLPEGVKVLNLTDQDLFYDFVHNQNGNTLKVGALSLQVVSPKERHRFLRIFFDKPINEQLNITSQIFIDQQGNEI